MEGGDWSPQERADRDRRVMEMIEERDRLAGVIKPDPRL
jgi:hypothetical protein